MSDYTIWMLNLLGECTF